MIMKEEINVDEQLVHSFYNVYAHSELLVYVTYQQLKRDDVYHVQRQTKLVNQDGLICVDDRPLLRAVHYYSRTEGPQDLYGTTRAERQRMVRTKAYRNVRLIEKPEHFTIIPDHIVEGANRNLRHGLDIYIVVVGIYGRGRVFLEIGDANVPIPVRYDRVPSKRPAYNTK